MKRPRCVGRNMPAVMTPLPLATLLLAAHVVLGVAELSGENVCLRRETYNVTLRVVVKEPVQVKTYTWCLKIPPRCTKYKVEMRDRLKTQTEMRHRVVDTCCDGHAPDRTGTRCTPVCSGCVNGVCVAPESCHCHSGYAGDRCDTECREGLWGSACSQQCQCQNGATCSHVTGECKCAEGWRGARCDTACPEGTFGHDCLKQCDCEDGDDAKNSSCHHVTGECKLPDSTTNENHMTSTLHPTTVVPTSNPDGNKDSDVNTHSTLQPLERNVAGLEVISDLNEQTHIISIDNIFTALTTDTFISTIYPFMTEKEVKQQTSNKDTNSFVTNIVPLHDDQNQTIGHNSEIESNQIHNSNFSREGQESATTKTVPQTGNSEPQNIQMPPLGRPIIVISDSLLSERRDEKKHEDSKNGVLYLVSSVSVAAGVALALIVMAAVTLLVSHRRNKAKATAAENEMASFRKPQMEQQQPTPAPQMYSYTEEVTTCPVQHLFPNTEFTPPNSAPESEALQLSFGNVSSTMTTNSKLGHPYFMYNNARAYLELQYDIPPSSISSRSNSLPPGMEPEHLYDEIPCWKSTTTTSTNTATSRC